jgi:hypothetical protein
VPPLPLAQDALGGMLSVGTRGGDEDLQGKALLAYANFTRLLMQRIGTLPLLDMGDALARLRTETVCACKREEDRLDDLIEDADGDGETYCADSKMTRRISDMFVEISVDCFQYCT